MPKEIATEGQDLVLDEEGEEIDKFAYDKVAFTNSLKITLEKEVLFLVGEVKTRYNILVNDRCVDICYDEAIALESYEKTKANYSAPTKQTIKEEFV
jgi:peroxiredoxin